MVYIDEEYVRNKCYDAESLGGGGTRSKGEISSSSKEEAADASTTSTSNTSTNSGIDYFDCNVVDASCTGDAVKISITIVSTTFNGVPLIKRHRMLNEIFATELKDNSVHALSVKAYTPKQWETKK